MKYVGQKWQRIMMIAVERDRGGMAYMQFMKPRFLLCQPCGYCFPRCFAVVLLQDKCPVMFLYLKNNRKQVFCIKIYYLAQIKQTKMLTFQGHHCRVQLS